MRQVAKGGQGNYLMSKLNRRDFLKLAALAPTAMALSKVVPDTLLSKGRRDSTLPNVIILVFDAMTARDLSLYNYRRQTTPNLERFAERATVYHAHHSAGNFTTPGVASLLTGMYPWTHRAINLGGLMVRRLVERNLFHLFGDEYHRMVFSQNILANFILNQFQEDIDNHLPPDLFGAADGIVGAYFKNDPNAAYRACDDFLFKEKPIQNFPGSLAFGLVDQVYLSYRVRRAQTKDHPKGLPHSVGYPLYFRLEDVFEGLISLLARMRLPCLAYIHLFPPHSPYRPNNDYFGIFKDNWRPVAKPQHPLAEGFIDSTLNRYRRQYDEYVANVDAEFGRLMDAMEGSGILDRSYVVISSDHGEMFERGERAHSTSLLYEPVVHIPLLISTPGQQNRKNIYSPTNSVDVMPTLLRLAGREIPEWCEGRVLPGLGGEEEASRKLYMMEAKHSPIQRPLEQATIAMIKGRYKLIHYIGYQVAGYTDAYELYDLNNDADEMVDLYSPSNSTAQELKVEMLRKIEQVDHS